MKSAVVRRRAARACAIDGQLMCTLSMVKYRERKVGREEWWLVLIESITVAITTDDG